MNNILIFRNQLFKSSEVFIIFQSQKLQKYKPLYVGRKLFNNLYLNNISLENDSFITNLTYILFGSMKKITSRLKTKKPILIHAHFGVDGVYALKLAKPLNIPLVTTLHGYDVTTKDKTFFLSLKPALWRYVFFRHKLFKECSLFLCASKYIQQKAIEKGCPKHKTLVHYIGVDTKKMKRDNSTQRNGKNILHVARLTKQKGTTYLIKAFAKLLKQTPDLKLTIIGEGTMKNQLKSLTKNLHVSDKTTFLGALPHEAVIKEMDKSDIFVLPSINEGLGMVLLEASAMELPIVATRSGGIAEVVEDGMSGFLFERENFKELTDKLSLLLYDKQLRLKMGKAGRDRMVRDFDIKKQTEKLEQIYTNVLKSHV